MKRDAVVVRRLADVPLKANRAFELARSDLWMRIGNLRAASVFALTIAHLFPPGMSSYDCATALACQASPLEENGTPALDFTTDAHFTNREVR